MLMKLRFRTPTLLTLFLALQSAPIAAQDEQIAREEGTFADVATLADMAGLVARVQVTMMAQIEQSRAVGVRPGYGRFYIEGKTVALLTGKTPLGEQVKYLVDLPLTPHGEAANLKRQNFLIFARRVPSHPDELQLVTPTAQLPWSPSGAARLRRILRSIVSPDAPPRITGVRELIYVPGPLAGQGRTQIFLTTHDGSAASITVRHKPGEPATWEASFSELTAKGGTPLPGTLEWYRLACFLPSNPSMATNLSMTDQGRWQASADYRFVLNDLGPCQRNLV